MKNLTVLILVFCSFLTACNNDSPRPYKENPKGDEKADAKVEEGKWFILDPERDGAEGVGSKRAFEELNLKNQSQVIVAVIDSGVDVNHEDLKGKIWENPGETGTDLFGQNKSTNKIDDDHNGYIDDVHGWNYLGHPDGRNVHNDTLELTREAARYDKLLADGTKLSAAEKSYYESVKTEFENELLSTKGQFHTLSGFEPKATAAKTLLKDQLSIPDYSEATLKAIESEDEAILKAKADLLEVIKTFRTVDRFYRIYVNTKNTIEYHLNKDFNPRTIVGDDPDDFSQIHYGNNNVYGVEPSHGTHVAGIIAAQRGNGLGADGVAENVKIMALRVVPNGDERDKDIMLAIRYAVDHGARIINMSFGKPYSSHKAHLDAAFLYAASKNVLIFHSAGNGASSNDVVAGYPNRQVLDGVVQNLPSVIPTWIEIGASARAKNASMVAGFSDYGKKDVDLFAPGVMIASTFPNNTYEVISGTSMASPVAAGVAALIWSNFPELTALELKTALLSHVRLYNALMVKLPGNKEGDGLVPFHSLSATGGVIDAFGTLNHLLSHVLSSKPF